MKHFFQIFMISFSSLLVIGLLYCSLSSPSRFENYCDRFFQEEITSNSLTLHYTLLKPEAYGVENQTITLGSFDTNPSKQKLKLWKNYLTLYSFARGNLSPKQQITYDLLKYSLKTELDRLDLWLLEEPLVPSIGIQSQLPILLAEYTFCEEADVINYLTLLSCIPGYFDSLLALEEKRCEQGLFIDQESACELISYCEEFLSDKETHFLSETFCERLETISLSDDKAALYIEENASMLEAYVFPVYERLKEFLIKHRDHGQNENGLFYLPKGTDYYAWLLRSEIGTDKSFEEIEAALDAALKADASNIASLIKKDPSLLDQRQEISLNTSNPAGLTSYLAQRASHDFPATEAAAFEICSVPSSMEAHLSPAFYLVPPLDDSQHNVVYLNHGFLKEGISFFTTLAHEAYPGHLYQTAFENASAPHPIHRLLYFGGYIEGWATYAEQFSYSYAPISKDLATLLACTRAMTLNLYSHLDLYVHAYGWTEDDCREYLKKFGITGAASVHDMFLLVKQQPANYLKYYLGYLEICELKEQAENDLRDAFNLKEFHEFILTCGPAPFSLLEKYMEEWMHSSGTPHLFQKSQQHKPYGRDKQTRQHI